MSVDERKAVLEAWIAASKGKDVAVIAHVGSEALADVKALTAHAAAAGAVAIAAMPTTFFKPDSIDTIISYFKIIAACAP
jgi:N-acetylneuraminate lyase